MPVDDQTPQVILIDNETNATPLATTSGSAVNATTPGIIMFGVTPEGSASFFKLNSSGSIAITNSTQDSTAVGTLNALNAAITLALSGVVGVGFQLTAGSLVGTIVAEISYDGGSNWAVTGFYDPDTKSITDTIKFTTSNQTQIKGIQLPQGSGLVRVRVSAYTSGTANGLLRANLVPSQLLYSSPVDGRRSTYSATSGSFASATLATDIWAISGSNSKTIRLMSLEVYGTQTNAGYRNILLVKRSTSNLGGTSITYTNVPYDSTNTAATAAVKAYTGNATTLGTLTGIVKNVRCFLPANASVLPPIPLLSYYANKPSQALVLRGLNESYCISLDGNTVNGGSFVVNTEWTEE